MYEKLDNDITMRGKKESRHHGSGVAKPRSDFAPREGDDRTRNRRLADIRRGNKTRHQLELLTSAHGGIKNHSSTPSSWGSESRIMETWSAKEKREKTLPHPHDLEARHSCPALPAISPSLGIPLDNESRKQSPGAGLYSTRDLSSNAKATKRNQHESLNFNLPNETLIIERKNSLDFIANARHPPSKFAANHKFGNPNSKLTLMPSKNQHDKAIQYESKPNRTFSVPDIASSTQPSETLQIVIKEAELSTSSKDGLKSGSAVVTKQRYSVLLNGGTLTTNAPYVARIGSETISQKTVPKCENNCQSADVHSRPQRKTTDDATKDREDRQQNSTTVPRKRDNVPTPSRRRGKHLRSHKELFAFQQDLLLPRYRKLAGISGNDGDGTVLPNDRRSADESQGDGAYTRRSRSDARKVFEKVRLIIKGPEKVETVTKPADRKVPQMMPIYLKSGLPCGYVDSSSKCDAWLDANDFDD